MHFCRRIVCVKLTQRLFLQPQVHNQGRSHGRKIRSSFVFRSVPAMAVSVAGFMMRGPSSRMELESRARTIRQAVQSNSSARLCIWNQKSAPEQNFAPGSKKVLRGQSPRSVTSSLGVAMPGLEMRCAAGVLCRAHDGANLVPLTIVFSVGRECTLHYCAVRLWRITLPPESRSTSMTSAPTDDRVMKLAPP
jgi:hypothetical protein